MCDGVPRLNDHWKERVLSAPESRSAEAAPSCSVTTCGDLRGHRIAA
jgi:hypothetical protein